MKMTFLLVLFAVFLFTYAILKKWFHAKLRLERRVLEIREEHTLQTAGVIADATVNMTRKLKKSHMNIVKMMERELEQVGIQFTKQEWTVILVTIISLMIVVFLIKHSILGPIVLLLMLMGMYKLFINFHKAKRMKNFEEGLGDMLSSATGALKAGYSLFQAMDTVSKETKGQISNEFSKILKEISLGVAVEEALMHAQERIQSRDFELIVNAILIQRQVGGNLAEVLDIVADTIRERLRMKGEIRALTAQGRMSMWIFILMAPIIGVMMYFFNSSYISYLWGTKVGWVLLVIAFIGQLIGGLIIRRIVNFDI